MEEPFRTSTSWLPDLRHSRSRDEVERIGHIMVSRGLGVGVVRETCEVHCGLQLLSAAVLVVYSKTPNTAETIFIGGPDPPGPNMSGTKRWRPC